MVDPYQRQVAPQRVGGQVGQANPQQFGAGVGDALTGIGGTLADGKIADLKLRQQQEEDAATLETMPKWAEVQAEIENGELDLRSQFGEDFAGYRDAVDKLVQERTGALIEGISNKRVRDRYAARIGEYRSEKVTRAGLVERGKSIQAQSEGMGKTFATHGNRFRRGVSLDEFNATLADLNDDIDALNVDGDVKARLRREKDQRLYVAYLDGLIENGAYGDAEKMLDTGHLDGLLDEKAMQGLRRDIDLTRQRGEREAELAQERAAREAELERRRAADAQEAEMDAIRAMAKDGNATPADLRRAARIAAEVGSPTDRYEIDKLTTENDTVARYGQQPIPAISTSIRALEARVAKAGVNAPVSDRVTLETLRDLRDRKMKEQAAEFAPMLRQGPQGKMSVLQSLDAYDREAKFEIANQAEAGLGYVALLGPALRPMAVEGREVRKQQPDLAPKAQIGPQMRRATGRVGRKLGSEYGPVMETASDIYAAWAAQNGEEKFNSARFDEILSGVLGASRGQDGAWRGGLGSYRGEKVLLPSHLTNAEFASTIARSPFANARYGNGKPADKSFIVNSMVPEMVDELDGGRTVYRFVDNAGGTLRNEKGGEYRLIIERKLR